MIDQIAAACGLIGTILLTIPAVRANRLIWHVSRHIRSLRRREQAGAPASWLGAEQEEAVRALIGDHFTWSWRDVAALFAGLLLTGLSYALPLFAVVFTP